jgi:hypothetical protein
LIRLTEAKLCINGQEFEISPIDIWGLKREIIWADLHFHSRNITGRRDSGEQVGVYFISPGERWWVE